MARHDVQNVSYMRKDPHFLADGVWYITTPCPKHGLVDEAVPWAKAKTPHHAGLIADARHYRCAVEMDAKKNRSLARGEIRAAASELKRVKGLLTGARKTLKEKRAGAKKFEHTFEAMDRGLIDVSDPRGEIRYVRRDVEEAEKFVARHERSVKEATQRVTDIKRANSPKKA